MLCHEHQNSSGALPEYTSGRVNLLLHSWPGSNKKANIRIAAIFFEWFRHSFWHTRYAIIYIYGTFIPTFFLAHALTFYLTFFLAHTLTFYLAFYLAFSPASGWCPAGPTEIWSSRLTSGSAHWPGARSWGPAVPIAIRNSQFKSEAGGGEKGEGGESNSDKV
jgi:hypothetical protein